MPHFLNYLLTLKRCLQYGIVFFAIQWFVSLALNISTKMVGVELSQTLQDLILSRFLGYILIVQLKILGSYLVIGAVITVALGWGCALWVEPRYMGYTAIDDEDVAWWSRRAPAAYRDGPRGFVLTQQGFGVQERSLWGPVRIGSASVSTRHRRTRVGWPLRALEGVLWTNPDRQRTVTAEAILEVTDRRGARKPIPLRPIWPGFLVDSIAGGAALWLLVNTPPGVRRLGRRRRNRCPGCGYPVGASPVCTECGASISS